jgi:hypothetical protein
VYETPLDPLPLPTRKMCKPSLTNQLSSSSSLLSSSCNVVRSFRLHQTSLTEGKSWRTIEYPYHRTNGRTTVQTSPSLVLKSGSTTSESLNLCGSRKTHEIWKHVPMPEVNSPMNHCPRTTLQKINIPGENQDVKFAKQEKRPTCGPWESPSEPLSTRLPHQIHYYVLRFCSA